MGAIEATTPGLTLELTRGSDVLLVDCGEGMRARTPAGTYNVQTAWLRGKHKGGSYELEGEPGSFKEPVRVEPEGVTKVLLGAPLKIRITTHQKIVGTGTVIDMASTIEGCRGEVYRRLYKNGRRRDYPLIKVRGRHGRVVHKGVFHYDNRGNCVYSWRIQSTIRDGVFTIEPVLDTGPFAKDEEFTNTFEIRR